MLNINKFNHIKYLRKHYKILVMWTIFEIVVQIRKQSAVKGKGGKSFTFGLTVSANVCIILILSYDVLMLFVLCSHLF